jgi:hypothetical protein
MMQRSRLLTDTDNPDLTGSSPEPASTSLAGTTHDLHLKTSYYTASVPIWLDIIASPSEWASSFLSDEAREVLAVLGGLVLVFAIPSASPTALTADNQLPSLIRHVGSVLQKGLGGWDWDGVRLAVGIGEGDADDWDELCSEFGMEFVQLKSGQKEKNEFGGMLFLQGPPLRAVLVLLALGKCCITTGISH